jgi:hypothetical protein
VALKTWIRFFCHRSLPLWVSPTLCVSCSLHLARHQDFEDTILNDLYNAIVLEFPEPPKMRSSLDLERSYHMHFVEDKSMHFIGRTVSGYVMGEGGGRGGEAFWHCVVVGRALLLPLAWRAKWAVVRA